MPSPTNITFSLSESSDFILSVISLLFSAQFQEFALEYSRFVDFF